MPVYVYECPEGHTKEVQASVSEMPQGLQCERCKGPMKRSYKNLNIGGRVEGGTNGGAKIGR